MRHPHRIVVHVDNAAVRGNGLRDLVGVARCRQSSPDIKELPDPGLVGQIPHGPAKECTRGGRGDAYDRRNLHELPGRLTVDLELSLPPTM